MIEILIVLLCCFVSNILFFSLGKNVARVESSILFGQQILVLLKTIQKVDAILSFKGKSVKDLTLEELVEKVQGQLNLLNNA